MALWKKLIYSGSTAQLNNLYVTNAVTASYFEGNGAAITGVVSASFATSASWAPSQPAVSSSYAATASVSQLFKPNVINGGEIGQTNYAFNPTGINDASMVLLSGTGSFGVLGGIAGNYKSLTLVNTGSASICITANDASASAINRIGMDDDIILFKNDSAQFYYDTINSVWRPMNIPNRLSINVLKQASEYYTILDSSTLVRAGWTLFAGSGGTSNYVDATSTDPIYLSLTTGTTSSGGGYIYCTYTKHYWSQTTPRPHIRYKTSIKIPTLSDGTNRYTVQCGIAIGIASYACSISYSDNVNSGKFRLDYNDGTINMDSGVTVVANTKYEMEILFRPDKRATYYINGVQVGELIGSFNSSVCRPQVRILKSVGTSARNLYVAGIEQIESRV